MEKIIKIEEVLDHEDIKLHRACDGYKITTSEQEIFILINNFQSCCEAFGYVTSHDKFDEFLGAKLKEIRVVDDKLSVSSNPNYNDWSGGAVFVNLETSVGTLQFVMYNDHNGYYGHDIVIRSKQLDQEFQR